MSHVLTRILGFSVIVPALVGIIRIQKINRIYLPFLICMWIGLLNECINYILIDFFHSSNAVNSNIYNLIESFLYVLLFKNLDLFTNRINYILLVSFLCATWLYENLVISKFAQFDSYFTIVYSLTIVLMSITMINRLIIKQMDLLTNPSFLICTAFILYFTLAVLTEIFWLYGLNSSEDFRVNIYRIMGYINSSVNLIFVLSILWMHRKQEFTPQQ